MTHMDAPTTMASTQPTAPACWAVVARSSPRKLLSSGTAELTWGSHEYRCSDSPASLSGVDGNVWRRAWYRPMKMGNCTTIGPRQPMGLTPASLYSFIVSREARGLSSAYFSWISFILGARALICLICLL